MPRAASQVLEIDLQATTTISRTLQSSTRVSEDAAQLVMAGQTSSREFERTGAPMSYVESPSRRQTPAGSLFITSSQLSRTFVQVREVVKQVPEPVTQVPGRIAAFANHVQTNCTKCGTRFFRLVASERRPASDNYNVVVAVWSPTGVGLHESWLSMGGSRLGTCESTNYDRHIV